MKFLQFIVLIAILFCFFWFAKTALIAVARFSAAFFSRLYKIVSKILILLYHVLSSLLKILWAALRPASLIRGFSALTGFLSKLTRSLIRSFESLLRKLFSLPGRFFRWSAECVRRTPSALRMSFPLRSSFWYLKTSVFFMPFIVMAIVPDIYGYGYVFSAAKWLFYLFPSFIFLVYMLRILVPLDMEAVLDNSVFSSAPDRKEFLKKWNTGNFLFLLLLFSIFILILFRTAWYIFLSLGFLFSIYARTLPDSWKESLTPAKKRLYQPAVWAFFIVLSLWVRAEGEYHATSVALEFIVLVFAACLVIHTLWKSASNLSAQIEPLKNKEARFRIRMEFFITAPLKLFSAAIFFYFILVFFSLNTFAFSIAALATVLFACFLQFLHFRRVKLFIADPQRRRPLFFHTRRPGLFVPYMLLVWISILYVQSYNRIPPAQATCDSLKNTGEIRGVWTMKDFRKYTFLDGALPYDAAYDRAGDSLYISFKNLTGYGAVAGVDTNTGALKNYLVTENDAFPGRMFYPERFCKDNKNHRLYVSTKSKKNFQLLSMDISGGGLKLTERLRFPDFETTNCSVDERNGDIYTIFLSPPNNHVDVVDGATRKVIKEAHFGRIGYADYFALDAENGRMVVPSLDPTKAFDLYDVRETAGGGFKIIRRKMTAKFKLFGLFNMELYVPTLGIAYNKAKGAFYFSCPFVRYVFETDGEKFNIVKGLFTDNLPRKIAFNDKQNLLLVANYSGGSVDVIDTIKWKIIRRFKVGKLVRSVSIDPETGRNFAVSACGVFEITPNKSE